MLALRRPPGSAAALTLTTRADGECQKHHGRRYVWSVVVQIMKMSPDRGYFRKTMYVDTYGMSVKYMMISLCFLILFLLAQFCYVVILS